MLFVVAHASHLLQSAAYLLVVDVAFAAIRSDGNACLPSSTNEPLKVDDNDRQVSVIGENKIRPVGFIESIARKIVRVQSTYINK